MMSSRRLLLVAVWALATVAAAGCGAPEPGWQRLWEPEWGWYDHGARWLLGVTAADRRFDCPGGGRLFRAELLNTGEAPATVRLIAAAGDVDWTLSGGEALLVELELAPGEVRIEAPPGVVLGSPRLGRPLDEPRLVVLVLVDTLRADHVTAELMPGVVDAFAGGRRWLDATANAPWTLPSVASLFSARPVLELTSPEGEIIGLPEGLPTWASRLHEAGFEGGAVVANYTVHVLNGFGSGFSSFLVPDGDGDRVAPDGSWVVDGARRFLAAHRGEDAFVYLHLMDPHEPYRRHRGAGPEPPPLKPLATRSREATAEEAELLRELYAGEVRHADAVLAPFLAELPGTAVVALVADHGEGLGEHGAWAHGLTLHQGAIHVPLMVRGPGVPAGDVDGPVQLLDLGPTLLAVAGEAPDPGWVGRSLLDGGSRTPLVSATFAAGPMRWAWRFGSHKVVIRTREQPGLGADSRTRLSEARPLPPGAFHVDLGGDPGEDRPGPIPGALTADVGAAFAGSAGRLVPGLQLLAWDGDGPLTQELGFDGDAEVVQAWSTGAVEVASGHGRLLLRCASASPLCAVAVASGSVPGSVTPLASDLPWPDVTMGEAVDPRTLAPPVEPGRGAFLWWNPERPLVVGGHEATLERLRALGYID